jgi:hypothetical protein
VAAIEPNARQYMPAYNAGGLVSIFDSLIGDRYDA